jgi:hypothetical protein
MNKFESFKTGSWTFSKKSHKIDNYHSIYYLNLYFAILIQSK